MPSPTLSGSITATRRVMMPSSSNRWMRFQQGVEDSPTCLPISATDSEAASCRSRMMCRSVKSIRQTSRILEEAYTNRHSWGIWSPKSPNSTVCRNEFAILTTIPQSCRGIVSRTFRRASMTSTTGRHCHGSHFIAAGILAFGIGPASAAPFAPIPVQAVQPGSAMPWMNAVLSPQQRADLLQAQMSRDEELILVMGYWGTRGSIYSRAIPKNIQPLLRGTSGYVPGIPRLGIPPLIETDAGLGIANGNYLRPGDEATALPSGMLMASTWDPDTAFLAGSMIGAEARSRGFNVVLDGAVNLVREPRGGRSFEYAGEDPLLAD